MSAHAFGKLRLGTVERTAGVAVGAAREWECIVVRAPSGKLRV